ncbi:MAG: type II toxin-antitoxin system prevent-host-death family antitoxin [Corynebacterium sp.]|nr:type II toxin-antitoxin system prevent-host-death family antitoxin [Corynebacterium sp.]
MTTTLASRDFNQNVSAAQRAAEKEPVIITRRGEPAFVLMSIDHYTTLTDTISKSVDEFLDNLSIPEHEYFEFEFPKRHSTPRVPEL